MPISEKIPKQENKSKKAPRVSLYDIAAVDEGGFEVVLPGLYDSKREAIVGTTKQHFDTREEAEAAIIESRERSRVLFDKLSLQKSFGRMMYKIDERPDGKFRVTLPTPIDTRMGVSVGTFFKDFDSWDEAKTYFLQERRNEERLTKKPILEIQAGQERIAFSDFNAFDPKVAPSETALDVPPAIGKYLLQREKLAGEHPSASTYQETIKEPDWERKIFAFVSGYLEKEGVGLVQDLNIKSLDALTPKQATELATRIVVALTKYKLSDTAKLQAEHTTVEKKTQADKSTALQLLQEGLRKKDDPYWEGNGVCRNFASMTKAVFEALKARQTKFSQLRDTYALYEAGTEYKPKRGKKNVLNTDEGGHAWNAFVTVGRTGEANATIVDTTWAKQNLDTRKLEGIDYTLTRMEPVVNEIGRNLPEGTPGKDDQLRHILSYYMMKIDTPGGTGGYATESDERQFYLTRAMELLSKHGAVKDLPEPFVRVLGEEAVQMAAEMDVSEIETLWKVSSLNKGLSMQEVLRGYLKDKPLTNYHVSAFVVKDDQLQREIFEQINAHPDFDRFLKDCPKFRIRMREAVPQLFIDFSPMSRTEDAVELRALVDQSQYLRSYVRFIDPQRPSDERINSLFAKARDELRKLNPSRYEEEAAGLDNYNLIKRYDQLYRGLKGK